MALKLPIWKNCHGLFLLWYIWLFKASNFLFIIKKYLLRKLKKEIKKCQSPVSNFTIQMSATDICKCEKFAHLPKSKFFLFFIGFMRQTNAINKNCGTAPSSKHTFLFLRKWKSIIGLVTLPWMNLLSRSAQKLCAI